MAGQLQFTLEDFQSAARKYRKELLMIPIIGIQESLKYMTGRPGIRYQEAVGTITGNAQFAPYKANRSHDFDLNLDHRILETYFGNVVEKFEPNSAVSTLLGAIGATKGDGQKQTPTAKHVLALIARSLSENLNDELFTAERDATGDTTHDLFNGFDTITTNEITAGAIAAEEHNFLELDEAITTANALDIFKEIMWGLDPKLRRKQLYIYCSQDIVDKYNEAYKLTTGAIPYNLTYGQTAVEGSAGRLIFCPLANKADSQYIHITDKANMLVGYDQMSDVESLEIARFAPFVLDFIATMFFGVQFEQIDKTRMKVVKLAAAASNESEGTGGGGTEGGGTEGGGTEGGDTEGGDTENEGNEGNG